MFLHVSVILFIGGRGDLYMMSLLVWLPGPLFLPGGLYPWSHVPSGEWSLSGAGVSVHRGLCQERISVRWGLCQEGISVRRVVSVRREVSVRTGVSVRRNLPYGTALLSCFFIILDITEKMSKDFDLLS